MGRLNNFIMLVLWELGSNLLNNEDLPLFQVSATEILESSLKGGIKNLGSEKDVHLPLLLMKPMVFLKKKGRTAGMIV